MYERCVCEMVATTSVSNEPNTIRDAHVMPHGDRMQRLLSHEASAHTHKHTNTNAFGRTYERAK